MEVTGAAERPSARGPAEWFTGEVWMDEIASMPGPGPARALRVHFAPGARTAWHVHPLGQVLHVTEGVGRVQGKTGPVRQVRIWNGFPARDEPFQPDTARVEIVKH